MAKAWGPYVLSLQHGVVSGWTVNCRYWGPYHSDVGAPDHQLEHYSVSDVKPYVVLLKLLFNNADICCLILTM